MSNVFRATMRAITVRQFGGSEVMQLTEVPRPAVKDNEVLVKLHYSGVNPVDTYIRNGQYGVLPELPYTPGKEGAGVVEELGDLVTSFKVGERVFVTHNGRCGLLAEYAAVDHANVFPLHQRLSFAEGAGIGIPYFTAHRALYYKGGADAGSRVLVHGGSGGVGQAVVQLAAAAGMRVVATAGTDQGKQLVKQCGATAVYNHREDDYLSKLQQSEPDKFDVIVEMLSNVNLNHDLAMLRPRGTVVVVGCRGEVTINPRLLMGVETRIVGCANFAATPGEWSETGRAVLAAIEGGHVKPVVAKTYQLHQAAEAHDFIMSGAPSLGKLVVKCNQEEPAQL